MPITAPDFLCSAIQLLKQSNEVDYRNSASRAYYSAYHYAKTLKRYLPRTNNQNMGVHQDLIEKLKNNSNANCKKIGVLLQQCKTIRTDADYKLQKNFTSQDADDAILFAQEIAVLLNQVLTPVSLKATP